MAVGAAAAKRRGRAEGAAPLAAGAGMAEAAAAEYQEAAVVAEGQEGD